MSDREDPFNLVTVEKGPTRYRTFAHKDEPVAYLTSDIDEATTTLQLDRPVPIKTRYMVLGSHPDARKADIIELVKLEGLEGGSVIVSRAMEGTNAWRFTAGSPVWQAWIIE